MKYTEDHVVARMHAALQNTSPPEHIDRENSPNYNEDEHEVVGTLSAGMLHLLALMQEYARHAEATGKAWAETEDGSEAEKVADRRYEEAKADWKLVKDTFYNTIRREFPQSNDTETYRGICIVDGEKITLIKKSEDQSEGLGDLLSGLLIIGGRMPSRNLNS